jgi:hypothetical protein
VAGCCECGDEPSGSGATELVSFGSEGLIYYRPNPTFVRMLARKLGSRVILITRQCCCGYTKKN